MRLRNANKVAGRSVALSRTCSLCVRNAQTTSAQRPHVLLPVLAAHRQVETYAGVARHGAVQDPADNPARRVSDGRSIAQVRT
jgi:hypothetical protein